MKYLERNLILATADSSGHLASRRGVFKFDAFIRDDVFCAALVIGNDKGM